MTIEDVELSGNWALSDPPTWHARGPVVAADEQATVIVRRSSLHDNRTDGGSLFNVAVWDSSLSVESSSLVNNTFSAGGIEATLSDVVVLSSTVDRISVDGSSRPGASLTLGCPIVGYCTPSGGNVTYTNYGLNAFFDGQSCVGTSDVDGEWNLYRLRAPSGKFPARVPNFHSAALEGGHPFICVALDQWSQARRPFENDGDGSPVLEIGAVEAATLIFLDGFEIGSTAFWSATVPRGARSGVNFPLVELRMTRVMRTLCRLASGCRRFHAAVEGIGTRGAIALRAPVTRSRPSCERRVGRKMRGGEQRSSGDLVEGIYAAALEPQRWPAVLRDLALSVGAPGAVIQVQATSSGEVLFAATGGLEESALTEYARHWVRFDPRVGVGLGRPVGEILIPEEHLGVAAFRRTAIYNDFLRPLELGATLGGIVHADSEIFVAASAQRSLRPPGFRERDRRRFVALAPHLARAARIGHELGAAAMARQALTDALDRLPRGVLLLDARLAVKFANTYAEEVLAAGDGLRLDRDGLQAARPADSATLRALVAGAAHPAAGGPRAAGGYLAVRRPSLRRPLELLVTPLTPELATVAPGRAVAAVFLVDPDRRLELPLEALRQLYGLTPAEARLASLLAEGVGLPEAAAQLGITRETAKSTLHAIFAKTDTRRQAELVRRLLTGPGACTSLRPSPRTGDADPARTL